MRTVFLILMVIITACNKDENGVCLKSTGKEGQRSVSLDAFSKINLKDNIDLEVVPGNTFYKAELIGGANLLEGIRLNNDGQTLSISNENHCNWLRSYNKKVKVKLYTSAVEEFTFSGAGTVTFADTNKTDVFLLHQWDGSGHVHLLLDTKETYIKMHTGVGDIYLKGKTDFLYTYSLCQGYIYGKEMQAIHSHSVNKSLGDFYLNIRDSLFAQLSNLGNIYVPATTGTRVIATGKGQVLKY